MVNWISVVALKQSDNITGSNNTAIHISSVSNILNLRVNVATESMGNIHEEFEIAMLVLVGWYIIVDHPISMVIIDDISYVRFCIYYSRVI